MYTIGMQFLFRTVGDLISPLSLERRFLNQVVDLVVYTKE